MKRIIAAAAASALVFCSVLPCFAATATTIRGDADGDGKVTISDVTAIQRHVAQMSTITGTKKRLAANVNGDKTINIKDATALQQFLAEYENVYNIEGLITYDPYELPFVPN